MKTSSLFNPLPTIAVWLALALLPLTARAQVSDGTVDLEFESGSGTYTLSTFENGSSWGTPTDNSTGASVQELSATGFSSPSLGLPTGTLYLFCAEISEGTPGQGESGGTPSGQPASYQILDSGSLQFLDSTNLASTGSYPGGTPNPQGNSGAFESASGIGATTGIGSYRAGELELLYGYVFGGGAGSLSNGYAPQNLSLVDQVAFQLDVWKFSHEGSSGSPASMFPEPSAVTGTGFSVTGANLDSSGIITEANSLLYAVQNTPGIEPMVLDGLNNGSDQDFLIPAVSFTQIPEPPATTAVLGAAALLLAALRARRVSKTESVS